MQPAASFSSLTGGLVQDILCHLDRKEQGRAACVSKLCAAAVVPLAPALAPECLARAQYLTYPLPGGVSGLPRPRERFR